MKVQFCSDLHLEFQHHEGLLIPANGEVLVLAGDIGVSDKACDWINSQGDRFEKVFYVLGNHEYYNHEWFDTIRRHQEYPYKDNVHFLHYEQTPIVHNGVWFVGDTMWTDLSDPLDEYNAQRGMNDYHICKYTTRKLTPRDTTSHHRLAVQHIKTELLAYTGPQVVVSHHLPHPMSVNERWIGNPLNPAFMTDLTDLIGTFNPKLWVHGHCVDEATEILTLAGWKTVHDIKEKDEIYSYNSLTKKLEKDSINSIIRQEYTGKVINIKAKQFEQRVTNKHVVVGYRGKRFIKLLAEDVSSQSQFSILRSGEYHNIGTGLPPELLELYIAFAADGDVCNLHTTGLVRFSVYKARKLKYIEDLLTRNGIEYNKVAHGFSFYMPARLRKFRIKGLDPFLINATKEECELILTAYLNTDGSRNASCVHIWTSKKSEYDILQHVFAINGYRVNCTICTNENSSDGVKRKTNYQIMIGEGNLSVVQPTIYPICTEELVHKELFWCIKSNNQNFIMRRNGRVSVTGNCHDSVDYYHPAGRN